MATEKVVGFMHKVMAKDMKLDFCSNCNTCKTDLILKARTKTKEVPYEIMIPVCNECKDKVMAEIKAMSEKRDNTK